MGTGMTTLHIELINVTAPYLIMAALIAALELIKKQIHKPTKEKRYY